jgi:hypothetical protein
LEPYFNLRETAFTEKKDHNELTTAGILICFALKEVRRNSEEGL